MAIFGLVGRRWVTDDGEELFGWAQYSDGPEPIRSFGESGDARAEASAREWLDRGAEEDGFALAAPVVTTGAERLH